MGIIKNNKNTIFTIFVSVRQDYGPITVNNQWYAIRQLTMLIVYG